MHQENISIPCKKSELLDYLKALLDKHYKISKDNIEVYGRIERFIDALRDDIHCVIETNYVDKVYRDTYYHYYATKRIDYPRNCIRISFLNIGFTEEDFLGGKRKKEISDSYLGFLVLRPIWPQFIGRNIIHPKALKMLPAKLMLTENDTTINSVKTKFLGFPHSSQDDEVITCAETTLWSLMEYFGNKYSDYKPVLPSQIHKVLQHRSHQRQVPSDGLNVFELSYAIRQFGFEPRVYTRQRYPSQFNNLIACYVESGIPLVISVSIPGGSGHAFVAIGRNEIEDKEFDPLAVSTFGNPSLQTKIADANVHFFDFDDLPRQFIKSDDNREPYTPFIINEPLKEYGAMYIASTVQAFVIPLYAKIHMEAVEAKAFSRLFLIDNYALVSDDQIALRTFLTSTRSLKHFIQNDSGMTPELKKVLLEMPMPKFVWVTEISSKEEWKKEKVEGLIVIDATEKHFNADIPLIAAFHKGLFKYFDHQDFKVGSTSITCAPFTRYNSNLKTVN